MWRRELTDLREVDCPTPHCTREAVGTGDMEFAPDRRWHDPERGERRGCWHVEFHCPRCGETFTRWTPELQRLAERLAGESGGRSP